MVLRAVEPVDRAGAARIRIRRGGTVDVRFEAARHRVVGRLLGARAPGRRHGAGAQLRDDSLPDVGMAARVGGVDRIGLEVEAARPEPVVVTGDAVAVQDRAGRDGRSFPGLPAGGGPDRGSGRLPGLRLRGLPTRGRLRRRRLARRGARRDGAGHHERDGHQRPECPAPSAAVRSHHPTLLVAVALRSRDELPERGIVPRDGGPGNTQERERGSVEEPSPPTHELEKLLPCQARVADQRSQETAPQFPVFRYRESPASRPNQNHVAAFRAIEGESDPRHCLHEVVSRENRESRHRYVRTSTI